MTALSVPRLDPEPNAPYGKCADCDAEFTDRKSASEHMSSTFKTNGAVGHRVRITNMDREERIERFVCDVIDDQVNDGESYYSSSTGEFWVDDSDVETVCENLHELVENGDLTALEVGDALKRHYHFIDWWEASFVPLLIASGVLPEPELPGQFALFGEDA